MATRNHLLRTLMTSALLISAIPRSYAQNDNGRAYSEKRATWNNTEKTFSMVQEPKIREFVWLRNMKIILELSNVEDLQRLKDLDSILVNFSKDISFYKDSLEKDKTASYRIDYVLVDSFEFRWMRFTRHEPDGDIFINRHGETSKLKMEQDTVRILLHVRGEPVSYTDKQRGEKKHKVTIYPQRSIMVTFCMNNYSVINKIIADSAALNHIIDTLAQASAHIKGDYGTISYRPFDEKNPGKYQLNTYNYLADERNVDKTEDLLLGNGGLGAALVKNTVTPMADLGVEINIRSRINPYGFCFARASTTPYFFFGNDLKGNTTVHDNWFVNLEAGIESKDHKRRASFGAGYLYAAKGNYFQKDTYKAFATMRINRYFTVMPELICNNNFKQIYPAITLKILTLGER